MKVSSKPHPTRYFHHLTLSRTDLLARGSRRAQPIRILHRQGTLNSNQDDAVMPPLQCIPGRTRHAAHVILDHLRF